jgi:hypothetical protein
LRGNYETKNIGKSGVVTINRTQNSEQSIYLTSYFGAVFTNEKIVPKSVELLKILQKEQVVELVIST